MSGRRGSGFGLRVHSLLLRLLPAGFRSRNRAAMQETFEAALARARHDGMRAVVRVWLRESWDLARTGALLRREARLGARPAVATADGWRQAMPRGGNRLPLQPRRGSTVAMLLDDFQLAARATIRSRGFFALAALTLALGVGATTAMYSALKTVVLDPLPFPAAERMVTLSRTFGDAGSQALITLEREQIEALREATDVFDGVEGFSASSVTLTGLDEPVRISALRVSAGVPALMGVRPQLGREFTAEETAGEGGRVALLSHGFWRSRFGGRTDVLGETLHLNGEPWTIVGVMPRHAVRPDGGMQPLDVWLPLGDAARAGGTLARLTTGTSPEVASGRVDAIVRAEDDALGGVAKPIRQAGPLHEHLRVLMIAVTLLLLVACVNVSNLLLQRATTRGGETALRAALGASRPRLFRQFAFESAILAGAGVVFGALLAHVGLRVLLALRPDQLEALRDVRIDGGVLLFCVAVSAISGLLFGLVPAVRGSRAEATSTLGRGGRGIVGSRTRFRWALVGAEIALSFALLIGAALVVSSLRELTARDPGFQADNLVTVDVRLPSWRHATPEARNAAFEELATAVRRVPRVAAVSVATSAPPRVNVGLFGHVVVEGRSRETEPTAFHAVYGEPHHIQMLGVPLVAGRHFTAEDVQADARPVILSESAAARLFPGEQAVGQRFGIEGPADYSVIGVVRDIRATGLANERGAALFYFPLQRAAAQMTLTVRTLEVDAQLLLDLRQSVRHAEPDAIVDVASARELLAASVARERFTTTLLSVFAALALVLAAVGLYGVLSQVVVARTREIGVRMALGADRPSIGGLVLRSGLFATLAGLAAGAGLSAAGLHALRSEVFGLADPEPAAYVAAALVLLVVAMAAMIVPVVRAARMDPLRAIAVD